MRLQQTRQTQISSSSKQQRCGSLGCSPKRQPAQQQAQQQQVAAARQHR
jgi:hypothetical protein